MALANLLARVDALTLEVRRHADVADNHVGVGRLGACHERVVVLRHADHFDIRVALEHRRDTRPDDCAVVSDEHGDCTHGHIVRRLLIGSEGVSLRLGGGASPTLRRTAAPWHRLRARSRTTWMTGKRILGC